MAILVGIDEAGYGPVLGPLVVSCAAFSLPDELLQQSLWEVLRKSVCRKPAGSLGRVAVNDSKKLHHGLGDYKHLQRGVLSHLAAWGTNGGDQGELHETVGSLLDRLDAKSDLNVADCPWYYSVLEERKLNYDVTDIGTAARALSRDLEENGMKVMGLWSRPMTAGRFNHMVELMKNKATVLFTLVGELIDHAYQRFGDQNLQIIVDRMGGRSYYRKNLQRLFPEMQMKVLKEGDSLSSYQLSENGRCMKIHFLAKGDDRHLPVALASMTSKYVRELFMEVLNDYFLKKHPDLTPTAGYYKDGMRFIGDLKARMGENLPWHDLLIRSR